MPSEKITKTIIFRNHRNAAMVIIVIIYSLVIHLLFSEASFNLIPYLLYPLLISLPSFTFILGLSFFMMRLIRNQAVVVLVLLGYFAVTLFYLSFEKQFIFDFLAWRLPLVFSDFVGISDFSQILLHRGIYFFSGAFFIFLSILLFNSLPQEKLMQKFVIAGSIGSIIVVLFFIYFYLDHYNKDQALRHQMRLINSEYQNKLNVTPLSHDIQIEHKGEILTGESVIRFTNNTSQDLNSIYFSLNPGLTVTNVMQNDKSVNFDQKN